MRNNGVIAVTLLSGVKFLYQPKLQTFIALLLEKCIFSLGKYFLALLG